MVWTHLNALPAISAPSEKILCSFVDNRTESDTGRSGEVNHALWSFQLSVRGNQLARSALKIPALRQVARKETVWDGLMIEHWNNKYKVITGNQIVRNTVWGYQISWETAGPIFSYWLVRLAIWQSGYTSHISAFTNFTLSLQRNSITVSFKRSISHWIILSLIKIPFLP